METLFLTILRMSGTAAIVILAVLLARLALRRAPKVFSYALWAVVLFRLLCPFTVESAFSLLPAVESVPVDDGQAVVQVHTGIMVLNNQVNEYLTDHPYQAGGAPAQGQGVSGVPAPSGPLPAAPAEQSAPSPAFIASVVWLAGAVLLLGYGLASLLRLRRRLMGWMPLAGEKDVRLADHIPSPFVLGVLRPKVYLPSDLPESERDYILLHERTHIRRCDHVFRALAWLALALHWFNPLVWLAFHLAGKDMEMSCDEAVLRKMNRDVRVDYSSSLLRLSTGRRLPAGPLAFGDGDPQGRIKNVLHYKKPALWVIVVALAAVLCAGVALATDRGAAKDPASPASQAPAPVELWLDYFAAPESLPWDGGLDTELPEFPGVTFRWTWASVTAVTGEGETTLFGGMPIWNVYLCDLNGDGRRELCATVSFGSGMIDNHIVVYDYANQTSYELWDRGVYDYSLRLEGGQLWAEERDYPSRDEPALRAGPLVLTESGLELRADASPRVSLPDADLTFSLEESEGGFIVRMEGSVDGAALRRNAVWWPQGLETLFGGHSGGVGLSWQFAHGGAEVNAWWANEEHTAVTLSTKMSAMLSSYAPTGWWEFTIDLLDGTVIEMISCPLWEEDLGGKIRMYPTSIPDGDALKAARAAAKLLTAAEDYYNNAMADSLSLSMTEEGGVSISGTVDGFKVSGATSWSPFSAFDVDTLGNIFIPYPPFSREDGMICAWWADGARTSVTVTGQPLALSSSGARYSGYRTFTVALDGDGGTITESVVSNSEGDVYLASLLDEEAVALARFAAKLLTAAEDYYNNTTRVQDAAAQLPPYFRIPGSDGYRVLIEGLGDAYAEWNVGGTLYFSHDTSYFLPARIGEYELGGYASWADEARSGLSVLLEREDTGCQTEYVVDQVHGTVTQKVFRPSPDGETMELTDREMVNTANLMSTLMIMAEDYYNGAYRARYPASSLGLRPAYSLNETGTGVAINMLDCAGAAWYSRAIEMDSRLGLPESGTLGYLSMENPRFLGGYFASAYGYAVAQYFPNEDSPLLFLGFDDYTKSVYDPGTVNVLVDLASGEVKKREISPNIPLTDGELADMARALAQLIQGAAGSWDELSNPPAEDGPLPFDQPMRLWFGSGAGGWRTILTLHPDGSFEGTFNDSDMGGGSGETPMGVEYICTFHGRFGDIRQASAASWTMTLETLTLDTGHPVGEEWIAERRRYVSSAPYGLDGAGGQALKPGAQFVFYTPAASAKPGGELYRMEYESSGLYEFWSWWPRRSAITEAGGSLGCYALRNVETGYGFFDLRDWGIIQ